jgi:perosamine synthetase
MRLSESCFIDDRAYQFRDGTAGPVTEMSDPIVLMRPYVPESAIPAVSDVLRSRWIGQGPKVEEFEREFSQRHDCRPNVAVGSCTDALHLAYVLAGIGPGDEVIAPLFTCTATNIPLLYQGARIKFADVGKDSLNVDPAHVASLITERTKAIVMVHYGGQRVRIVNHLLTFAPGRHIPVIEDCAQALGEPKAGLFGDFACFSFQAVKHVCTGDGGMLLLDESLLEKAKRIRWFGIDRQAKLEGKWANDITEVGFKYQMTDIAAAMGLEGLKTLDWQIAHRRSLRDAYARGLEGIDGIRLLDTDPNSACWLCTVLVERREDFRRKLKLEGIESDQVHYRNDRYSIFQDFRGEFPNMDAIDGKYLCLPLHMGMDVADVERVCWVVKSGW